LAFNFFDFLLLNQLTVKIRLSLKSRQTNL